MELLHITNPGEVTKELESHSSENMAFNHWTVHGLGLKKWPSAKKYMQLPPGQFHQAVRTVDPLHSVKSITSGISWQRTSPVGPSATYSLKVNPLIHAGLTDFSQISIYDSNILSKLNIPS